MAFGVVFNGKSGFLHGLYYQNISYNGHYRCGSGRGHAQYADFLGTSCAETYIRFLCQRTVRISCNDDKFQFRIQVMRQLCQFDDFPCFARIGDEQQQVVAIFMAICPALPMPEVTSLPFLRCTCSTISSTAFSYASVTGIFNTACASFCKSSWMDAIIVSILIYGL